MHLGKNGKGVGGTHMKVVILAGGMGTRFSEETTMRPKPMIEIGNQPILWHIMKTYATYGFFEFIICCGYKGAMIKDYFINYNTMKSDSTFNLNSETLCKSETQIEPWKVTLANTGLKTLTAGRLQQIKEYVGNEPFLLTYGDGVSDVNIKELISFHESCGKIVTISTTRPEGRFGVVKMNKETHQIEKFQEKERSDQGWVNMGYMVCNPEIFDYLGDGNQMLEAEPFTKLANEGEMCAYQHEGFWSPMDNIRDRAFLQNLWNNNEAPWKTW